MAPMVIISWGRQSALFVRLGAYAEVMATFTSGLIS